MPVPNRVVVMGYSIIPVAVATFIDPAVVVIVRRPAELLMVGENKRDMPLVVSCEKGRGVSMAFSSLGAIL